MNAQDQLANNLGATVKAWRDANSAARVEYHDPRREALDDCVSETHAAMIGARRAAARFLRDAGTLVLLSGGGNRGASAYHTHANGTAEAIMPHKTGAALVLLSKGDPENFSLWASVCPVALASCPVVRAYLRARRADIDVDRELAAFRARQAAGQVG